MKKIILSIRNCLAAIYHFFTGIHATIQHRKDTAVLNKLIDEQEDRCPKVYYLGITAHSNLGDMAQHYCITKWIKENYPNHELIMFESNTVVDKHSGFLKKFKAAYRKEDIIVFQSGYTTQDLGGNHEYMHRLIVDNMPYANILMMPQTIYFQKAENKHICSESLDKAQHMLFLARDFVSEEMAKEMFPHQPVKAFPDIVTTLIGSLHFNNERDGVCMCCRNDGEKYYSDEELSSLMQRLQSLGKVTRTDTTIKNSYLEIRQNMQSFIEGEIEKFSHYKVVITDRYHGTIFAIAAGTPVVILKTTDHKVTTGADWFKGVYDDYVVVSDDIDDAYQKAVYYMSHAKSGDMMPYFKQNYYDKLKEYFGEICRK